MLLDDIIATAVDSSQRLSVLLRKCLLLAHELKNDQLKSWANQELNGFASEDDLPEYRIIRVGAYGDFSGVGGAVVRHYPIPPAVLEERHQILAQKAPLLQAVSAYEGAVATVADSVQLNWPGNIVLYYQRRLMDGYALVSAWQMVPKPSLVELLDTIRNRVLNMALEIKDELGAATNLRGVSPAEVRKIEQTIVNNIYGGTNYLVSGQSQMTASTTTVHTAIPVGNRQELDAVLLRSGLTPSDLQDLTKAVQADASQKMGSKVTSWVKATAPKVISGGVRIGTTVARELLTEWLKQYFGLTS
jgi:hypothetical protein